MDLINKTLGARYEVIEEIGVGGMAVVYKARCKLLNRFVAVKVLKPEFSKDAAFVKKFRAEAQSAASLTHPNIVSVYDVGEENGINYIVMELLEGSTLKDEIEKRGKLGNELTLKYASQIASALEAAHSSKIVHRDIKPQNIVLTNNNIAKVTDFGIARMSSKETITSSTNTIGSVHYFSPEHAKGAYTDEKSDIYSLGIVMYEMATGKLPFNADTPVSVALKQIQEEPMEPKKVNPDVSDALNNIILKAMKKSKIERYQTATEMLDDIFAAINSPLNFSFIKQSSEKDKYATRAIPIIGLRDEDASSLKDVDGLRKSKRLGSQEENKSSFKIFIKNNKKKLIIIMSVLLVVIFGILIGSLVKTISKNSKQGSSKIEVAPNLVGQNFEEVQIYYEALGLKVSLNRYENSSEVEEGKIISQDTDEGLRLNTNEISVVVSKGSKKIKMVDVVGKDYTVAKYELTSLGIEPDFEFKQDDKVAQNIILSQEIEKGEEVAVGSKVKIYVSSGDGKVRVIVPNLLNCSLSSAKEVLAKANLKLGTVTYKEDASIKDGLVISQSEKENAEVEENTAIDLVINRLQKSRDVEIDLSTYITDSEKESATVKITADVEGVTNTIYPATTVNAPFSKITVTVNGFTSAKVKIYIDSELVETKEISFN